MRGLTLTHILSMSIFLILLWGIGTSDAPYSFNFSSLYGMWETTKIATVKLWQGQGELAKRIDAQSKSNSVGQPHQGICDPDTINKEAVSITPSSLALLSSSMTEEEVITALGVPLCQTFDKDNVWKMTDERLFTIGGYAPITSSFYN